jgi:hypothetical protein
MPVRLDPNPDSQFQPSRFGSGLLEADYEYKYPRGLDFKPGSEFHEGIRGRLWAMAWDGKRAVQGRYNDWRETDRTLKAYVPADQVVGMKYPHSDDRVKDSKDKRKLDRIVMPVTFANLETLLTYMTTAFLQDPVFTYEGVGPEDTMGAYLLTQHVAQQCHRSKVGLGLHTQWRDAFAYGFGVVSPVWYEKHGTRVKAQGQGFLDRAQNLFLQTGKKRRTEQGLLWEGNKLINIDPYRYFPDPGVSIHEPQEAEFHAWLDEDSLYELLSIDRGDGFFNAEYLKHVSGMSSFSVVQSDDRDNTNRHTSSTNRPVDTLYYYVTLIPEEWGLGSKTTPEKWMFALAADQVIIKAQPLGLYHDMYPIAVAAPGYDGYSPTPTSYLEVTSDLQDVMDFLFSSHIANLRKAINDMLVVDPSLINIYDLNTPEPGKLIRMRRSAWGRGGIDAAIKQLDVKDVTQGHVADGVYLQGLAQQVLGTPDNLQGVLPRRRGERISASEAQSARVSGLARLEKIARLISMQSMQDIGYMFASHTQQFATREMYARVLGELPLRMQEKYGQQPEDDRILIDPMDMLVDVDIRERDGTVPGSEDVDTWMQLLQVAAQSPEMFNQLNIPKIFTHIARHMGAKNVEDFLLKAPKPTVKENEQVLKEADAGNLVPIGGDGALPQ